MPTGIYQHKHLSEEHKKKIGEATLRRKERFGYINSPEARKKMSNAQKGKHLSEKTKMKMSESRKGKKHPQEFNRAWFEKGKIGNLSPQWKDSGVGYRGIHCRIIKIRGRAKNYKCVDCGKQAQGWSNVDHRYTSNPEDYFPRCESCHRKYDNTLVKEKSYQLGFVDGVNAAELRLKQEWKKEMGEKIDCEVDCIRSGNALTPQEQDIAIGTCDNIRRRL